MNYFRYGANEIDDLFKEILQDDKEIIHNIVGRDFSDEKHFKEFIEYENWHTNELLDEIDDDLDDDDLLAELERVL